MEFDDTEMQSHGGLLFETRPARIDHVDGWMNDVEHRYNGWQTTNRMTFEDALDQMDQAFAEVVASVPENQSAQSGALAIMVPLAARKSA